MSRSVQCAYYQQGQQVLVAVEPHRVVVAEAALYRGNDQADLFPVPQPAHGHAGESAGLGVGECENFLTSIRYRMSSFFGCSNGR